MNIKQSVKTATKQSPTDATMLRSQNCEIVAALFERLTQRDVDGFLALFTDDGRQVMPYSPGDFPKIFDGWYELEKAYRPLFANYADVRFGSLAIEEMANENRFLATYKTDILLTDGRRYGNNYIAIFSLRGGQIEEWIEYFNPIILQQQLGNPFEKQ